MSLKLWLPLDGNLKNKGLNNASITGENLTLNTNGKIGDCYSFNGTNSYILSDKGLTLDDKEWSFCAWIKLNNNSSTMCPYSQRNYTSDIQRTIFLRANKKFYIDDGLRYDSTLNTTADLTEWTHYAFTRSLDTINVYINGLIAATLSCSVFPLEISNICGFGASQSGNSGADMGSNFLDGYMNDIRLYNHALSQKEVKDIAKALVRHFALDGSFDAMPNLIKNSNFQQGENGMSGYYTQYSPTCTKQEDCLKVVGTQDTSGIWTSNYETIETGVIVTFSAYVKADSTMTIYIGIDGSGITNCQAYTVGTEWQRISITKEKTTNNANPRIYGNGAFYVKKLKYELGSKITSWIPHIEEPFYKSINSDLTKEIDISGYGHHGIKTNLTYNSDSARYNCASVFNAASAYIESDPLPLSTITISVWVKTPWVAPSSAYNLAIYDANTGLALGWSYASAQYIITYIGSGNGGTGSRLNLPTTSYTANQWNHIVLVKTGNTTRNIYVNGVLASPTSASYWAIGTHIKLLLGCRNVSGTYYNFLDGQMSDFRAYATALTADDVKELYEASAEIDNDGSIYTSDFVED